MEVLRTVSQLRAWRNSHQNKYVGFVPTMGALHDGHLALLRQALAQNDVVVISIFVNPSQFAPHEDLEEYPKTLDDDLARIEAIAGGHPIVVFVPPVLEMYPSTITLDRNSQKGTFVEVLGCSETLEGASRPNFFRGVATVVNKLFNAVQPNRAYFGQKDIQQCVVIKQMVRDLLMPIEIVVVPTVREESGLAMSSRNTYLDANTRQNAAILYNALRKAESAYVSGESKSEVLLSLVRSELQNPIVENIEYIAINDLENFAPLEELRPNSALSAAIVIKSSSHKHVRLIDNIVFP